MNFDEFLELKTAKKQAEAYYQKQWIAYEALERIDKNLEKIIEVLNKINDKVI